MWLNYGPGWCSRYSNLLWAGQSREWIPVEAKSPAPLQTSPGVTQPPVQWVLGAFLGVKLPGYGADNPPHLAPRLKKEYSYTSTPLLAFMACTKVNFTFYVAEYTNTTKQTSTTNQAP